MLLLRDNFTVFEQTPQVRKLSCKTKSKLRRPGALRTKGADRKSQHPQSSSLRPLLHVVVACCFLFALISCHLSPAIPIIISLCQQKVRGTSTSMAKVGPSVPPPITRLSPPTIVLQDMEEQPGEVLQGHRCVLMETRLTG